MMLKRTLSIGITLFGLCLTTAYADFVPHNHQETEAEISSFSVTISPWAEEAVAEAMTLDFGPESYEYERLPETLAAPITRDWFCKYISRFIAFQQNSYEEDFRNVVLRKESGLWYPHSPFSDTFGTYGMDCCDALYYLGIFQGRGDGIADLGSNITRQEAAALLCRTYQVYGGILPEKVEEFPFKDAGDISSWARESVTAVFAMGIMEGDENGNFMPQGLYSHEQCLVSLVRMYEKLPISRKYGAVAAIYSYEEYMEYMDAQDQYAKSQNSGLYEVQRLEGEIATFVESESRGGMHGQTYCTLIYKSGGIKTAKDIGICDTGYGYVNASVRLENPWFSEDGKTLHFTVIMKNDVGRDPSAAYASGHWHKAGSYHIAMDVETLQCQVDKPV